MKPIQISREEYYDILEALTKKSRELHKDFKDNKQYNETVFLSESSKPCGVSIADEFNYWKIGPGTIWHFLSFPCTCKESLKQKGKRLIEQPICLHRSYTNGKTTYSLGVHRIGKCPHKKPRYGEIR